jgi:hypothetical protein
VKILLELRRKILMMCVLAGAVAGGLLGAENCRAQVGSSSATPTAQTGSSNGASNGASNGTSKGPSATQTGSQDGPSKSGASGKDQADDDPNTTRLKIVVRSSDDKPVGNASVYVRFNEGGGFMHKDKLAELSFKTNDDGTVKVPPVPIGKILIQVVGKGIHTYGKWYDIGKNPDTIEIKLEKIPHWY